MEQKKIKLIWEFYGDDGLETAKHHAIHLEEFCKRDGITHFGCGSAQKESFSEAFLIVEEENMIPIRDALRPKSGEWVE